jgi:N-acetylmuramoyl-L-alanine amidase-like protein
VIGAAGGAAAAAALTPVVYAATNGDSAEEAPATSTASGSTADFPRTRTEAAADGATALSAAFPIGYAVARWEGARSGAAIRFAQGDWQPLDGDDCATVNGGGTLVAAPGTGERDAELRLPDDADGLRFLALDTALGPLRTMSVPAETTRMRGLAYLSRAAWGADESLRFSPEGEEIMPQTYYPVQTITVHHTATPNADPDPAATVRAIYEMHAVTNTWGDIGYHFLIDEDGRVYEGRFSGDDGLPAHDTGGDMVSGAHVGGYNSGNLGIALLGTLGSQSQGPTDASRDSLVALISVLTRIHGIDARGETTFVNPVDGVTADVPVISGHRDWMATECPGDDMYAELAAVRRLDTHQGNP